MRGSLPAAEEPEKDADDENHEGPVRALWTVADCPRGTLSRRTRDRACWRSSSVTNGSPPAVKILIVNVGYRSMSLESGMDVCVVGILGVEEWVWKKETRQLGLRAEW